MKRLPIAPAADQLSELLRRAKSEIPIVVGPDHHVLVVAAIVAGNAPQIERAVASVRPFVDEIAIVNTGATDDTMDRALEAGGQRGLRTHFHPFVWDDDFARARNTALEFATRRAKESDAVPLPREAWALLIDSDEWMDWTCSPESLRTRLASTSGNVAALHVLHRSGEYSQPRLLRLPAVGRFTGRVHEAYEYPGPRVTIGGVRFADEPKSPEAFRAKLQRDLRILSKQVQATPTEQRWWFYLGQTYEGLGGVKYWQAAIHAYTKAASLDGWDEEGAWAGYRAGWLRASPPHREATAKDRDAALRLATKGLRRHPGIAELHWLAGYLCFYLGRPGHAAAWAESAMALGNFVGIGPSMGRTLFRAPEMLYEKPFELAAFAWERLGKPDLAADLRERATGARLAREARAAS
jgi:tetratricopeptide (TPR) repeat protein